MTSDTKEKLTALLLFVLFCGGLIYAIIRINQADVARKAHMASVCMPYAVIATYNRLGKTMVVCAQPDGGVVDREMP
jgi:hypothetical protein